jgi:hypothetical protein
MEHDYKAALEALPNAIHLYPSEYYAIRHALKAMIKLMEEPTQGTQYKVYDIIDKAWLNERTPNACDIIKTIRNEILKEVE